MPADDLRARADLQRAYRDVRRTGKYRDLRRSVARSARSRTAAIVGQVRVSSPPAAMPAGRVGRQGAVTGRLDLSRDESTLALPGFKEPLADQSFDGLPESAPRDLIPLRTAPRRRDGWRPPGSSPDSTCLRRSSTTCWYFGRCCTPHPLILIITLHHTLG